MTRSVGIMQYWAGCPQTPNSKWQRFLCGIQACSQRGWRTYLVWSHMPDDLSLSRPFQDAGCRIILQPRARRSFDLGCIRRTYKLLRDVECDVFHCHNVHCSPLIAATLAGVPVRIWSKLAMSPYYEQGTKPTGIRRLAPSFRVSCMLAHRVLAASRAVRDELIEFGASRHKVLVWPAPIDVESLSRSSADGVREELGLSAEDILITTVGHAVPVKGWDVLVRAFAKVHAASANVRLLLVGSNSASTEVGFAEAVFHMVRRLGLERGVRFLGQRADVPRILRASDVFVLPSRSEGRPLALAEALATGLPCLASRSGGVVDLIEHRDNGLLFEREDVDGLAACLEELLRDGHLRCRLAQRGKASVQTLSLARVTKQTVDFYETLLAVGSAA